MHRKARLCVFYLRDPETALAELRTIEQLNVVPIQKAESALLLGDIFLMRGDYLAAQRQYDSVEEQFREAQVGAMARFRGARLNYYRGEFSLAQARLKILKDNTSNDIANDAIQLFLTIQDNIGLDSSTYPLERFAAAQLLAYQHKSAEALSLLDSIAYAFPNHPLADDILWQKAQLLLEEGKMEEGMTLLHNIVDRHSNGVLADDALFSLAEIYQYTLNNPQKAQQLYLDLLLKFPSSLYKVEARKRIRQLRGDRL
jgi:outer membrane protein assembly factor BamD (BamD/ComL family)